MLRLPGATMFLSANKAHLHSKGLSNVRRCELGCAMFSTSPEVGDLVRPVVGKLCLRGPGSVFDLHHELDLAGVERFHGLVISGQPLRAGR